MSIATRHPDVRPSAPPPPTSQSSQPSRSFHSPYVSANGTRAITHYEQRTAPLLLSLVELDVREVVEGVMTEKGYMTAEVVPVGPMREACPHCAGVALQLVLRHRHVKRSHLFCRVCTRCYDALNAGGHSVLTL